LKILLDQARSGNPQAQAIIARAGRMFAMGLANVVNIFAPEMIILSGHEIQYEYIFNDAMITEMKTLVVQGDNPQLEVQRGQSDSRKWELGAAAYAIDGVAEIALNAGLPGND
jgi:predicted NBD/HSP70 family sugar kinase